MQGVRLFHLKQMVTLLPHKDLQRGADRAAEPHRPFQSRPYNLYAVRWSSYLSGGVKCVCVAICRAGSAQPVAYDTPYDDDGQSGSEGHHERNQQGGEAGGVQHKGPGGLMGHMYNRKLEQAQQVIAMLFVLGQTYIHFIHFMVNFYGDMEKPFEAHFCSEAAM